MRAQADADVLWTLWEDADGTKHARVVRGRNLTAPDLRHARHVCENEGHAIHHAESFGDEISVSADGKTLAVPEPAVPEHHVAMLLSGRFLTSDGQRLKHDDGIAA